MLLERAEDGTLHAKGEPSVILRTHPAEPDCYQYGCSVHSPSTTHMSEWPMNWRTDRAVMERICEHGVGHPDPDSAEFFIRRGMAYLNIHGCDFCCTAPGGVIE